FECFLRFFSNFCAKIGLFLDVLRNLRFLRTKNFLNIVVCQNKKLNLLLKILLLKSVIIFNFSITNKSNIYNFSYDGPKNVLTLVVQSDATIYRTCFGENTITKQPITDFGHQIGNKKILEI
ncbi:hypothetical protein BpHYR1_015001, partial [Brachionus plicatilis]